MLLENMTTNNYRNAMFLYSCALKSVITKLETINEEFALTTKKNPIESIKSRLKSVQSIEMKLKRRGYEPTLENALTYLDDLAGARVICSFIPDIYKIADIIKKHSDITVLRVKDYIENPKPNGYRSYHMLLEVPVCLSTEIKPTKVELQIRTIAMDFWATLEHKIRYKFEKSVPDSLNNDLLECATIVASLDDKMYDLNKQIETYIRLAESEKK